MKTRGKADALLLLVTLLAAISWIFSREAVLLMPPLFFMSLRFLLAGAMLAAFGFRQLGAVGRSGLVRAFKVGAVFGVGMAFWVMGLFTGHHLGEGAFLTSLGVVLVPVMAALVFRERQPAITWVALPLAVAGLALLSLRHGFRPEAAQVFYVTAAAIFALYFTLNTRAATGASFSRRQDAPDHPAIAPLPLTTVALLTVGVITGAISLVMEPWQDTLQHFSGAMAGWILASALVGTAARFLIQTYAQSLSTNTHGVVIMVLEPVWVATLAALWFGESMLPIQWAGCALIFAALLVNRHEALRRWLTSIF